MKILFTADLHGNPVFYQDLLRLVESHHAERIILGGDLLPRRGHGPESLNDQIHFIQETVRLFCEKLRVLGLKPPLAIPGNNDWEASLTELRKLEEEDLVWLLHKRPCRLMEGYQAQGYPYVPPTPFPPKDFEKRDIDRDTTYSRAYLAYISQGGRIHDVNEKNWFNQRSSIEQDLDALDPAASENELFVMHSPPYDTMLDRLYNSRPAGSKAIRAFIEKRKPYLTLHGHVHESPVVSGSIWDRFGRTLSVNPGQSFGLLSAVLFDLRRPEQTMFHTIYGAQSVSGSATIQS